MHRLAITWSKLRKDLQRVRARLCAQGEVLFPELAKTLRLDTLTARHLLERYLTPDGFLSLNLDREPAMLMLVSREQHGGQTLLKLQALARRSAGGVSGGRAYRRARDDGQLARDDRGPQNRVARIAEKLIELASTTPYHAPLLSASRDLRSLGRALRCRAA